MTFPYLFPPNNSININFIFILLYFIFNRILNQLNKSIL